MSCGLVLAEAKDFAAREERRVPRERRILGGRPDERERPVFDVGKKGVLLRLVEAVDLVDEQDGPLALVAARLLGLAEDDSQLGHAAEHRVERDEARVRRLGEHARERRLARSRRAPEDHRRNPVGGDRARQELALTDEVLLPSHVGERARTHPLGEGNGPAERRVLLHRRFEERLTSRSEPPSGPDPLGAARFAMRPS